MTSLVGAGVPMSTQLYNCLLAACSVPPNLTLPVRLEQRSCASCNVVSATPSACSFCKHCSWPCGICGLWLLSGSAMQVCCWMCRQSSAFLGLHALCTEYCTEYSTEYSIRLRLAPLRYTHHIYVSSVDCTSLAASVWSGTVYKSQAYCT